MAGVGALAAGETGSEIGLLLASLVALEVLGTADACCEPADAACLGAGADGASSALAIEFAVSRCGFGTGYSVGIEPRFAYV